MSFSLPTNSGQIQLCTNIKNLKCVWKVTWVVLILCYDMLTMTTFVCLQKCDFFFKTPKSFVASQRQTNKGPSKIPTNQILKKILKVLSHRKFRNLKIHSIAIHLCHFSIRFFSNNQFQSEILQIIDTKHHQENIKGNFIMTDSLIVPVMLYPLNSWKNKPKKTINEMKLGLSIL